MKPLTFCLIVCLNILWLSSCAKDCNADKKFSDPRTPSGNQYATLQACQAQVDNVCNFTNGNVAQTMGRLVGNCDAYCKTPQQGNKACKPVARNFNTGKGKCEPEPLTEQPTYYFVMCENLSIDCSCE